MKINSTKEDIFDNIFKQYDIRGKYPKEINQEIAYLLGWALVGFAQRQRKVKKIDILVGRDNRKSSDLLFKSLTDGIRDGGGNVISIGICTSPMFYFASGRYRSDDGGVMITASHLSKGYNGFKLVRDLPIPIDIKTGLKKIREAMKNKIFKFSARRGRLIKKNILYEYVKAATANVNLKKIPPFKVVIDTGNAPAGIVIPEIFKKTRIKVFHLFSKLNGDFPNRSLNCTKEKNLKKLRQETLKRKADLGVAFDGDGDRVVFFDEKGRFVSSAIVTAFVSSLLLKTNPDEKILYTVNQGRIIPETVKKAGGKAIIWKVGHSNIKRKMQKDNILFGGEASAHFYYRGQYFAESPFFVLFKILQELARTRKRFSELIRPFQKYFNSGELNFKVKNKKKILTNLENKFKKGKILKIDGLRIDFPTWWFSVRFSHTEPLLRLVVEAESKKLMNEEKKEIASLIANN